MSIFILSTPLIGQVMFVRQIICGYRELFSSLFLSPLHLPISHFLALSLSLSLSPLHRSLFQMICGYQALHYRSLPLFLSFSLRNLT